MCMRVCAADQKKIQRDLNASQFPRNNNNNNIIIIIRLLKDRIVDYATKIVDYATIFKKEVEKV